MDTWKTLASDEVINKTAESLRRNGFTVLITASQQEAKEKALSLIPQGSEVMNMTSVTLDTIGITEEIENSGLYNAVKNKLKTMDRKIQSRDMQKLGAAPEYAIGSIHAVTQDGHVMLASRTGSQMAAYVYGSSHVIWVVGTQKIVENVDEAKKRIYEYCLPLESERAHKAYGIPGSEVSRLLLINDDIPQRTTIIFVKEILGF